MVVDFLKRMEMAMVNAYFKKREEQGGGGIKSGFLFGVVMGRQTDEVRQETPWTVMFADDIGICSKIRE